MRVERLVLLRHAKSAYPSGVADHDRPLSDRGVRDAQTIADHLAPFLPAEAAVSAAISTALRTQQTWTHVAARTRAQTWTDRSLYLASADELWQVCGSFESDIGIIVGHNPGLEVLAKWFPGAPALVDEASGRRMIDKFPTAAFVVLDCRTADWGFDSVTCTAFRICR